MQTQFSEKQPEVLFLTNVYEMNIQKKSRRNSFQPIIASIETWFEENAKMLSQKKQRAKRHRQRLKQIESQFQKKKDQLQRSLQQKIAHSSQVKSKTLEKIQQRLHKKSQKVQKISQKTRIQQQQQIKKNLQQRKNLEPEDYQYNSKYSRKSRTSSNNQRGQLRAQKTKKSNHDLDLILYQYKAKQERAKDFSLQLKKQAAQRARSHNSIDVINVKNRAESIEQKEKLLQSLEVINKLGHFNTVRKNKMKLIEEKNKKNHKSFSQKIDRIKNNLLQLQQERNVKYDELTQKFEKKIERRGWREKKTSINSRRLIENLQALESEQMAKVNRIVEKHRSIDQKYRFHKQKKQQLYKTYKESKD